MNTEKTFQSLIQIDTVHDLAVCSNTAAARLCTALFILDCLSWSKPVVTVIFTSFYAFKLMHNYHAQSENLNGEFEVLMSEYMYTDWRFWGALK